MAPEQQQQQLLLLLLLRMASAQKELYTEEALTVWGRRL